MKFLVSIAIGPVQDFIAAARRTRDLWYGSWLLSELSKTAARNLVDGNRGCTLIFPPSRPADAGSIANKLLLELDARNSEAVAKTMDTCRKAVIDRLVELGEAALKTAQERLSRDQITVDAELARAQLGQVIEFYSAWQPLGQEYRDDRKAVELRLAGRKSLRNFEQSTTTRNLPKSSLDGARESVLVHTKEEGEEAEQFWVRRSEQLDAMGLMKRFGKGQDDDERRFHSTIDVAARPYVRRLEKSHPKELADYQNFLRGHRKEIPFSYGYLYQHESRQLRKLRLKPQLDQVIEPLGRVRPDTPYFALLAGDGDGMGRAISERGDPAAHRQLSDALAQFAGAVEGLVNEHDGQAVYAGGDDVLAFLPLHRALECAQGIRNKFTEAVQHLPEPRPTFSAGLAVAHALEPLTEVRAMAHRAESDAKKVNEKDAICIVVEPRSGASESVADKWGAVIPDLQKIVDLYLAGKISKNLGHEFQKLLSQRALQGLDSAIVPLARAVAKKKRESPEAASLLDGVNDRKGLERLMRLLFVARPFSRAKKEAAGG